jgi:RNA-directed DNA polymerase
MNSSQFKKNERKHFCAKIRIKPDLLDEMLANIDSFYDEWIEHKKDKVTGLPKTYKDGTIKARIIRPSIGILKVIQKRIQTQLLSSIKLSDNVHGGVKGCSNISNGKKHQGNKYIFRTDQQDFFPNISSEQVYKALLRHFSPNFAHWITQLTTWKYQLPQGTPTSTALANIVFHPTDLQLIKLCGEHNITYTRYVDDLTFSSQQDFREITTEITAIITGNGFKISYRKTLYSNNQTITGIKTFLNKIDAPESIISKSKTEEILNSPSKPITAYLQRIRATNKPTGRRRMK